MVDNCRENELNLRQFRSRVLSIKLIGHATVGTWSMAGAHFDEMVASKPPVDPSFPAAATEQAGRKSLRPESLHNGRFIYSDSMVGRARQGCVQYSESCHVAFSTPMEWGLCSANSLSIPLAGDLEEFLQRFPD